MRAAERTFGYRGGITIGELAAQTGRNIENYPDMIGELTENYPDNPI